MKLKFAFQWKADGAKNIEILEKLGAIGLDISKQKLVKVFNNPFYCGIMRHGLLEGKVVEHKHERLISKELFLKVHEIRITSPLYGIQHNAEHEPLPLKTFMKCGNCGTPMTGYIVKKKSLWYYKCRVSGCKHNVSAKMVNQTFKQILECFSPDQDILILIKEELNAILSKDILEAETQSASLKSNLTELQHKIDTLEERFYIIKDISQEMYDKFMSRYAQEKTQITGQLSQNLVSSSNLLDQIEKAVNFSAKLPYLWESSEVKEKEKLQNLIFPEGISLDSQNRVVRTTKINSVFQFIGSNNASSGGNKKGTNYLFDNLSLFCELLFLMCLL